MSSKWTGRKPKILLSSVFGPYAQDDEFGSRSINPMELYHNQVTRSQGPFSVRMFHRSWGILMIQANISAPCTVLDFPTREALERELREHQYDIVGISSIIVNAGKVREMCRLIRELSPASEIVIGGHVTAIEGIEEMMDADHFVRGEGISWMRRHLGEDDSAPIKHPLIPSAFRRRFLGIPMPDWRGATSATIIPSVGCPMGCNFCTTSSFFGGKGKYLDFFKGGDELFDVMREAEAGLGTKSFFVMDENFLLNKKRAMRLLERMKQEHKSWDFQVFSSANAIRNYTMLELVELGVSWLWMGLESPRSGYAKLANTDTIEMTRELRRNGIRVLGSTIIGLEHHTPENIHSEIEHAVRHNTDFHQFMLYTPVPGTPLHREVKEQGRLIDVDLADIHGQFQFNFVHPAISREQSKTFLDYAFDRDYERNGPSIYRICRTTFEGWKRYGAHADARIRARFESESRGLKLLYSSGLWAMERKLNLSNANVSEMIHNFRAEFEKALGPVSSLSAGLLGPLILWAASREERRLAAGKTYEPPTFIERMNWAL